MALRDIKRQARRDLHSAMQIPAYYLRTPTATPLPVHVRLHDQWGSIGDIKGSRTYPAMMENENPKLVFDLTEIAPARGAVVSIEAGEAYRIDNTLDPDDQFQHVWVVKLTAAEAANLPVPPPGGF